MQSKRTLQVVVKTLIKLSDDPELLDSYFASLSPDEINFFTLPEAFDKYPSVLQYLADNKKYHPVLLKIFKQLKKVEEGKKDEKQPSAKPKPLDAIVMLQDKEGYSLLHDIGFRGGDSELLIGALDLISDKVCERAALLKETSTNRTVVYAMSHPSLEEGFYRLQQRLSDAVYNKAELEKNSHRSFYPTVTANVARFSKKVWNLHLNKLHDDTLRHSAKFASVMNNITGYWVIQFQDGEGFTAYQQRLSRRVLNEIMFICCKGNNNISFSMLHSAGIYQNFDALIQLLNRLSPFTIRTIASMPYNLGNRINNNKILTKVEKESVIMHYITLVDYINNPEDIVKDQPQAFIAYASSHLKNTQIIDGEKWVEVLNKALAACADTKIQDQLRALLGRVYFALDAEKRDAQLFANAYKVFSEINNPDNLDLDDNLFVADALTVDLTNLEAASPRTLEAVRATDKNAYDIYSQGIRHTQAALRQQADIKMQAAALEKKALPVVGDVSKYHKDEKSPPVVPIVSDPIATKISDENKVVAPLPANPDDPNERIFHVLRMRIGGEADKFDYSKVKKQADEKSNALKILSWNLVTKDLAALKKEVSKEEAEAVASLAKQQQTFEYYVNDIKTGGSVVKEMQRELYTVAMREHSLFPSLRYKALTEHLAPASKSLKVESKEFKMLTKRYKAKENVEKEISSVKEVLEKMIHEQGDFSLYIANAISLKPNAVARKALAIKLQTDIKDCCEIIGRFDARLEDKIGAIDKLNNKIKYHKYAYEAVEKEGSHLGVAFKQLAKINDHTVKLCKEKVELETAVAKLR